LLENNFVSECGQNSSNRDRFLESFSKEHLVEEVELYRDGIYNTAMVPIMIYNKNDSSNLIIRFI
jgi:hypothetical protein